MTTESLAISSSSETIFSKIFSYELPDYSYSIIQQDKETLYFDFSTRTSSRDEIAFNGLFLSQEGTILRDFKIEALRFDDRLGFGVFPRIIWGAYEAEEEALYLYADYWEGVGIQQLIKIQYNYIYEDWKVAWRADLNDLIDTYTRPPAAIANIQGEKKILLTPKSQLGDEGGFIPYINSNDGSLGQISIDGEDLIHHVDFVSDTTVLLVTNRRYVDGNPYYGFRATAKVVDLETGELLLSADIPAEEPKLLENNSYFSHLIPFEESFKSYNISTGESSIGSAGGLPNGDDIYWLGDGGSYRVINNTLTKLTADNKFGFNYVFDYPYPISVTLIDYTDAFIKAQVSSKDPFDYPDEIVGIKIISGSTPTDINLSELAFSENIDRYSSIASISSIDADTGDTHTYALVSGGGDADNNDFVIDGNELKIKVSPDYETKDSYSIRLKTTDEGGLSFERSFSLFVNKPSAEISTSINKPQEGYTLTTAVTTKHITTGTDLYWSISGDGIDLSDFSSGNLTGSGTVDSSGSFAFQHTIAIDRSIEGYETIEIALFSDSSYTNQIASSQKTIRDSAIEQKIADVIDGVTGLDQIVPRLTKGQNYSLSNIRDYDGNLHAGSNNTETASAYKYHHSLDINNDGTKEAIYTNKISGRWVTASIDPITGMTDFSDYGQGGGTRVVGIYEDPLIAVGEANGGFLSDGVTPAPANFGVSDSERYVTVNGNQVDRLALNSQVRFQNDLYNDNLEAKVSGDYDSDGITEVYWKTVDGTAYLRALMHDDGNIRYANYQNEQQMTDYLTENGYGSVVSDII